VNLHPLLIQVFGTVFLVRGRRPSGASLPSSPAETPVTKRLSRPPVSPRADDCFFAFFRAPTHFASFPARPPSRKSADFFWFYLPSLRSLLLALHFFSSLSSDPKLFYLPVLSFACRPSPLFFSPPQAPGGTPCSSVSYAPSLPDVIVFPGWFLIFEFLLHASLSLTSVFPFFFF